MEYPSFCGGNFIYYSVSLSYTSKVSQLKAVQMQRRECLHNNLLLLELNVSYMERKHKIPFNKNMFIVPNKKGYEVVTHFLFSKLNEAVGTEEYKIFFPVMDRSQSQEFRKSVITHLSKIAQEDSGMVFPQIVPSVLLSPGGEKFIELYLAFSTYVLKKFIEKDGIVRTNYLPPMTPENQKTLPAVLRLCTKSSMKKFYETQKTASDCHQKLEERAKILTTIYRRSKQRLNDSQSLLQDEIKQMSASSDIKIEDQGAVDVLTQTLLHRAEVQVDKVEKNWRLIAECERKEKECWEIMQTELAAEGVKKCVLDAKDYVLQLPSWGSNKCWTDYEKEKINLLYRDGKLCLISLIDLWITCLGHYIRIFEQGKLPKVQAPEHSMTKALDILTMNLSITKSLSERIETSIIPSLKQNVQKLESSALTKLNACSQDNKWMENFSLYETSTFNLPEVETNQSYFQPEPLQFSLGDLFQNEAISDPTPICQPSQFLPNGDSMRSNHVDHRWSLGTIDENVLKVSLEDSSAKQENDSLDLIISPLREKVPKVCETPLEIKRDVKKFYSNDFLGLSFRNQQDEEEIFSVTLPTVPLFDSPAPSPC